MFGRFGQIAGAAIRKFGVVGKEALSKFGSIKSSYNNINNAFNGAIGNAINSIPVAGPILKSIGSYLDRKETFKQLEGVLDHARVYGRDLEAVGNKLSHR